MWMACSTLEEIALAVDCMHPTVKTVVDGFVKSVSESQTYFQTSDFDVPIQPRARRAREICCGK
jgi:hypothetical protein